MSVMLLFILKNTAKIFFQISLFLKSRIKLTIGQVHILLPLKELKTPNWTVLKSLFQSIACPFKTWTTIIFHSFLPFIVLNNICSLRALLLCYLFLYPFVQGKLFGDFRCFSYLWCTLCVLNSPSIFTHYEYPKFTSVSF